MHKKMIAALTSIHESDDHGQKLLNDVVQLFTDLLVAGGATTSMIGCAMDSSVKAAVTGATSTTFTELGSILRDCMEVMCVWRRDIELVDENGEPRALRISEGAPSFEGLCKRAGCTHPPERVLAALLDFSAVAKNNEGLLCSQTPTFLVGAMTEGGRIATDGLIKHLGAFLRSVHRNVCSVSGHEKARFERACTVTVAAEMEPVFDQLVRSRGQEFIDSIDEWLERHSKVESPTGRYVELGAGAYFISLGLRRRSARGRYQIK
jgi:hypothetical protein